MALDAAKMICDIGLTCWDRVANYRKYIRSLGENLTALKSKVDELDRAYDDVNQRVGAAEGEGRARTREVDGWLKNVETLKREAGEILEDGEKMLERKCLCGLCFCNCRPRYKQSRHAEDKKAEVEHELSRAHTLRVKENVAYEPADLILKRSIEALREKMGELQNRFETVKQQVEREEKGYQERTPEVDDWLKRVEDLLGKEALEVLKEGELELEKSRQRMEGDSQNQRDSPLYHGISKRIDEKRAILERKLVDGRGFAVFTGKPIDPVMLEIPSEPPVGAESVFKEILNWVDDETMSCIGLFGMGGVGKTSLLNRVHNQLCQVPHDYNLAVRIVVSRPVNLDRIQEDVLQQLKLPEQEWGKLDRIRRASLVHDKMKEKKFLLFLDDLWDHIDLVNDIGIPHCDHSKKCKIILTTRDEGVCHRMHTDKRKKVECLPSDEALELFRQKLGEDTWGAHPLIPEIAKSLVHECQCLPIALITVARAMSGTIDPTYWMDAEDYLKGQMSKFEEMSEKVLANLEFSYQHLPSKTHKICFLYLSIFPEDHEICEDDAIDLWIGEGFLDDCGDVHEARKDGERIFRRLKQACLVESMTSSLSDKEIVKLHDVIREMALWVDSAHGSKTNTILVQENLESFRLEELKRYDEAKRMFLWGPRCNSLAAVSCSHLSTLIIRWTYLRMIPDDFFLSMPCLEVLDLKYNLDLGTVPNSIWKLINLRYLNLDLYLWEYGQEFPILLPAEIKNLNKLEVLILSGIFRIPSDVLSNLSSVKVFVWLYKFWHSAGRERGVLEELLKVQSIVEISIYLTSQDNVKMLMGCKNLLSHLRGLSVRSIAGFDLFRISTSSVRRLEHLSCLELMHCDTSKIEIAGEDNNSDDSPGYSYVESVAPKPSSFASLDIFHSLRDVTIKSCVNFVDVTLLIVHAPTLKRLNIGHCPSLKEVIVGDIENISVATNRIFLYLEYLSLMDLESLERICRTALLFPSLKKIEVLYCSKLKKLPFNCDSAKSLQVIKGEKEWFEELEWDDPAAEQVFSAKFAIFSDDEDSDGADSDGGDPDDEDPDNEDPDVEDSH